MKKISIWYQKALAAGLALALTPLAHAEEAAADPLTLFNNINLSGFSTKILAIGGSVVLIAFIITGIFIAIKAQKPARGA